MKPVTQPVLFISEMVIHCSTHCRTQIFLQLIT